MSTLPPIVQPIGTDTHPLAEAGRTLAAAWSAFAETLEPPPVGEAMAMCSPEPGAPPVPQWQVRTCHPGLNATDVVTATSYDTEEGWVRFWLGDERAASYRADVVVSVLRAPAR